MKIAAMKKLFLALLCMGTAMSTFSAVQQSGVIKLQGEIRNNTCMISMNNSALIGESSLVNVGRHSAAEFTEIGRVSNEDAEKGKIKVFAEACPIEGKIQVTFSGQADKAGMNNSYLAIDPTNINTAQNVAIAIYKGKLVAPDKQLELNTPYHYQVEGNKQYEMDFRAAYVSIDEVVTAGEANGILNVNLAYR